MNFLGLLLGAGVVTQFTGYPSEISDLRSKMPKEEKDAFIRDYKKLSKESKKQFKNYLQEADLAAAGTIIGRDLTQYKAVKKETQPTDLNVKTAQGSMESDITERVNRIMSVPNDIDPDLVAEAALKYQDIQGSDIVERVNRILAVPTDIDPALVAEAARKYEEAVPSKNTGIIEKANQGLNV